jgi:hypothetical protein
MASGPTSFNTGARFRRSPAPASRTTPAATSATRWRRPGIDAGAAVDDPIRPPLRANNARRISRTQLVRSAVIGSTAVAVRAGIHAATIATAIRTPAALTTV